MHLYRMNPSTSKLTLLQIHVLSPLLLPRWWALSGDTIHFMCIKSFVISYLLISVLNPLIIIMSECFIYFGCKVENCNSN